MRKRIWKRLTACALALVLLMGTLPTPALAAIGQTIGNSAVENAALLEALRTYYGDDAEKLMAVLRQYGLLDEEGNLKTSEKINLDGTLYTLDELQAILDDPDTDLSRVATVDGTPVTLENLKLMVEIERELARIQALYFTDQPLSEEQADALLSFYEAAQNGDVLLYGGGYPTSGYDHEAMVSLSVDNTSVDWSEESVTATFTLSKTLTYPVSFRVHTMDGEAEAGVHYTPVDKTVTIPAGENSAEVTVSLLTSDMDRRWDAETDRWDGGIGFYIRACDPEDIQFKDRARTLVQRVEIQDDLAVNERQSIDVSCPKNQELEEDRQLSDATRYLLNRGVLNRVDVTASIEFPSTEGTITAMGSRLSKPDDPTSVEGKVSAYGLGKFAGYSVTVSGSSSSVSLQQGANLGGNSPLGGAPEWVYVFRDSHDPGWTTPTADRVSQAVSESVVTQGFFPEPAEHTNTPLELNPKGSMILDEMQSEELATEGSLHFKGWAKWATTIGVWGQANHRAGDPVSPTGSGLAINQKLPFDDWYGRQDDGVKQAINDANTAYDRTSFGVVSGIYPFSLTATFQDTIDPEVVRITAPEGPFYAGDVIPITVEFDEPVNLSNIEFRVAGSADGSSKSLLPANVNLSSYRVTFHYIVQESDSASIYPTYLKFQDFSGNEVTLDGNSYFEKFNASVLCEGQIHAPLPLDAFNWGFGYNKVETDEDGNPVVYLELSMRDRPEAAVEDLKAMAVERDGRFYVDALLGSVDGGQNKFPFYFTKEKDHLLVCYITLEPNLSGEEIPFTAEVWWAEGDGEPQILLGLTQDLSVPSPIFAGEGDFAITASEDFKQYAAEGENPGKILFYQEFLDGTLPEFSLGLEIRNDEIDFQKKSDFAWASTDETVATINNDPESEQWGTITLTGKSGTAAFTLTALNGGAEGKKVTLTSGTLTVDMGSTPFLMVPEGQETLTITQGQNLAVNWTSNLSEKNGAEDSNVQTSFRVELFDEENCAEADDGTFTVNEGASALYTTTVTGNAEKPAASAVIPAEYLTKLGYPAYRVRVSYGTAGAEDYLELWYAVNIKSAPAGVSLDRPESLYILDNQGSLDLSFTLSNFVTGEGTELNGKYELYIVDSSGENIDTVTNTSLLTRSGVDCTGSYTLSIPEVELSSDDKGSFRDVYTVALKAKNGPDATWSYDSFLLYVYSNEALRLWIDGEPAGGSLTMTNVPEISALYAGRDFENAQAAVLAMNRDISLKRMISINYGDYAWDALCDRVAWSVEDNAERGNVATVNYNRAGLYENIEYFDRESYAPTDEFILSGLADGSAKVTVKHALTGSTTSLDLSVETLTDQLYLFQCYPKLPTTLTYTNGDGETKTVKSEADGRAAVYEPSGIASDVFCRSETEENNVKVVYLGTVYHANLVSGERDSTRLELYPLNNLQLRRAAQATLYFKNPDGTPYTGTVTFRGGVYRQGEYAKDAKFAFQDSSAASHAGTEDQNIELGSDGKLVITMDVTQFTTSTYPDADKYPLSAGEELQYMMELRFTGEGGQLYQPIFTSVDATLNEEDVASSGDAIYTLKKADSEAPFIAGQTVRYAENGDRFSVLEHTGSIGPSTDYPSAWLSTSVLWWGDELPTDAESAANAVILRDATQRELPNQTVQNIIYPFSTMLMTTHSVRLDEGAMNQLELHTYDSRNLSITLSRDGANAYRTSQLPFKLVNMIGAVATEESESLYATLEELGSTTVNAEGKMSTTDELMQKGIELVASNANYSTEQTAFSLKLAPTEDPLRFLGFITINLGNMGSGHNITGVYPADGSGGGKKASTDFDYLPSALSVAKMCAGSYLASEDADAEKAMRGKAVRNIHFELGGYMESEIIYNTTLNKWEIHVLNGGFHAGGGMSYNWHINTLVGIVPVVISSTIGGTMEISMDAQDGHYTYYPDGASTSGESMSGTDILTELRLYIYARVFAGLGFDISILALKIGVFGQIDLDIQLQWLNRPYLAGDDGKAVSDVGPSNTRTDSVMAGQKFSSTGTMGIEFFIKFLFVSYEKIFASVSGELFNESTGQWQAIQDIWAENATINGNRVRRTAINGVPTFEIDLGAQLEDRSYLTNGVPRVWGSAPANGIPAPLALNENGLVESLQTNAYPYANPVVVDKGKMMFYLSDMDSGDVSDTRVLYSFSNSSGQFQEGHELKSNDGYGDSSLQAASGLQATMAVWVRQMAEIPKDITGYDENNDPIYAPLTPADQALQSNSTEIMAAVYNQYGIWDIQQLTENSTPDLAPVVSASGDKFIVAWRSAASSGSEGVTTFDQQDKILYRIYDRSGWSEQTYTLYDGSSTAGAVKGLQIAMAQDGTAAVAYTLDTAGANSESTEGWETLVAIIPPDGSEDGIRTVRLTDDNALDENPQITCGYLDGGERFVVGWHTQRTDAASGNVEDDIRLAALNKDGSLYNGMPSSVSTITAGTDLTIGSNFRFAKNATSHAMYIKDLCILWVDHMAPEDGGKAESLEDAYSEVGYDVLKAVKFIDVDGNLALSSAMTVADMRGGGEDAQNSMIDHFDAWASDDTVHSILLATQYGGSKQKTVTVERGNGETSEMTLTVADPVSGMYTATGTFTNQIEVPTVAFDYDDIYLNTDIPVQFTVRNSGVDPIERISIQIGDGKPQNFDVSLLPNQTVLLTASCPVGETVENMEYTVTAQFDGNDEAEAKGKLYLDIPDVGISGLTLVEAKEGLRTIQFSLYNQLTAPLKSDRDTVKVAFYADAAHTIPLKGNDDGDLEMTITGDDLALINSGGYSQQVTIDVRKTLEESEEIPETGFPVYALAWIEQEERVVSEYHASNNAKYLNCQSLLEQYNAPVHTDSVLTNSNDKSKVTVTIQNNSLLEKPTGNVIVTLYDAQDNVVEVKQVYTGEDASLIALNPEAVWTQEFQFSKSGARAEVTYSDLILEADNAELASLSFSNIPGITLESFVYNETTGHYEAKASADDLTSTSVTAATKSGLAKAKVVLPDSGEASGGRNALSTTVALTPGEVNTITVTVTSKNNSKTNTYVLTVQNNGDPVIDEPTGTPNPGETSEYSASVYYAADQSATINLKAATQGDYRLSYQWYSCDADGSNRVKLENETASTLTIPSTTDTGVYYYRCEVIRHLLNGGTKEFWSSVASVQIKQADGNEVVLTGTAVEFDNQSHGLTSAKATKENSTLYYSTDGGQTWSETAPAFTSVGVHTVWVKATNPNYVDSEIVTADVVIQEKAGTQFKLETGKIADAFDGYPESIKDKYTDADGLETALKAEVVKAGVPQNNTQVYNVKLMFSLDGGKSWSEATADNFPAAGVTVKLPYPEGADRYNYNFTLLHLITDPLNTGKTVGDLETVDITLEEDGIRFTADCLSPFVLGWERRPSSSSTKYTVAERDTEHGSFSVKPTNAERGDTVTITTRPDEGYQVESIAVTTRSGRKIEVEQAGTNRYTFKMPSSSVYVEVKFEKENHWTNPFTDVSKDAWYYDAVQYVNENGLMAGTSASTFAPDLTTTRGMIVTILYRLEGAPDIEDEIWGYPFQDVDADAYYATAVYWARMNGIVAGYSDELFGPNDTITREQMAVILYRYAQYKGYDTTAKADLSKYTDAAQVGSWAVEAIRWANAEGLVNGTSNTTLTPKGSATRAQAAVILTRFCEQYAES